MEERAVSFWLAMEEPSRMKLRAESGPFGGNGPVNGSLNDAA
jgi:hypothetical protein